MKKVIKKNYTRKLMKKLGNEVYGRGHYMVRTYDEENKMYNRGFANYMDAYNYLCGLFELDIYAGFTIKEYVKGEGYVNRGFIGC